MVKELQCLQMSTKVCKCLQMSAKVYNCACWRHVCTEKCCIVIQHHMQLPYIVIWGAPGEFASRAALLRLPCALPRLWRPANMCRTFRVKSYTPNISSFQKHTVWGCLLWLATWCLQHNQPDCVLGCSVGCHGKICVLSMSDDIFSMVPWQDTGNTALTQCWGVSDFCVRHPSFSGFRNIPFFREMLDWTV